MDQTLVNCENLELEIADIQQILLPSDETPRTALRKLERTKDFAERRTGYVALRVERVLMEFMKKGRGMELN
jgi:Holliday junction resolvasome RuvABC ATP-dependent DNA helicase subunit